MKTLFFGFVLTLLLTGASSAQQFVYVTNIGSNNVSVIDADTNMVVGPPIPVGTSPYGVAITPNGTRAYVVNQMSNNVSVIDIATNTVVGPPILVGGFPEGIAITPDGARAYVGAFPSNVSVIDTSTNMVVGPPIPVGFHPTGIAITPDGTRAYVANTLSNSVSVIDTATNTVVGSPIPVGVNPEGIAVTPDGTRAYVVNSSSGNVSVIDTATNTVVGSAITVGTLPVGISITPDGARAYVVNSSSNNVSVINTATNMVVGSPIQVGTSPYDIAITPDGTRAYVVNLGSNNVSVVDTATNMVVDPPIPAGTDPIGIAIAIRPAQPSPDIELGPGNAENFVLTEHMVTATVDEPIEGILIDFEVISGPNMGETSSPGSGECSPNDCTTNVNGEVSWTYTGDPSPGMDTIVSSFFDEPEDITKFSNTVTTTWLSPISLSPTSATNDLGTEHTVTALIETDGGPLTGKVVDFEIIAGPNTGKVSGPGEGECAPDDCTTDADGKVSWTYDSGRREGTDTIVASFFDEEFQETLDSNMAFKTWVLPLRNIPTLSEWSLIALAGILGIVGFMVMRRRKAAA